MEVIIETPKWSFVKYVHEGGRFRPALKSPLPTLFNYGYVKGVDGRDGMPQDAIVLGARLPQGGEVEVRPVGVVRFTDCGLKDDKMVTSKDGRMAVTDMVKIHAFFTAYALFKTVRCLLQERRLAMCLYGGLKIFGRGME